MANPSDKQMLRDANGDLIPQYWDVVAGEFKPLTGSDGAQDTRLTGSNMEYYSKDEATMPSANSVPLGAFCMVVDTGNIWQSDGTDWKVFA